MFRAVFGFVLAMAVFAVLAFGLYVISAILVLSTGDI